ADQAEDLAGFEPEAGAVDGADASERFREVADLEHDPVGVGALAGGPAAGAGRRFTPVAVASDRARGPRRTLEEHRAHDVVAIEQVGGRPLEAHLALLEEVG